ncbi:uncharacterized protein LOC127838078 isoform X2 [Dreissena polymorpha]|nr:uncharacterized protein LOC127838078 isoform X2 [Dreissena polymorpha]
MREKSDEILNRLAGAKDMCFIFGSQSEGTTTPGLQSDTDIFHCCRHTHVIRSWDSWEHGKVTLLMLKDDTLPPQQYMLQITKPGKPELETILYDGSWIFYNGKFIRQKPNDDRWVRYNGKLFLSSDSLLRDIEKDTLQDNAAVFKAGPSVSFDKNLDVVKAMAVYDTLPEIQKWIGRSRPGHWPTPELLEMVRDLPCFLVPSGHPLSKTRSIEWRFSPNLIERHLMFSFNITQIKCFVVLKMIKKTILYDVVPDGITTFHCKTTMMYAIERTPKNLWTDDNLIYLIRVCLQTLKRWLRVRFCPHYIVKGSNLFDGKLTVNQCLRLCDCLNTLGGNVQKELLHMKLDNIGEMMSARDIDHGKRFNQQLNMAIQRKLDQNRLLPCNFNVHEAVRRLLAGACNVRPLITAQKVALDFLKHKDNLVSEVAKHWVRVLFLYMASIIASSCLEPNVQLPQIILEGYTPSLRSDAASSRLKLASMLLSAGYLPAAAYVLQDIERRCYPFVRNICCCGNVLDRDDSLEEFAKELSTGSDYRLREDNIAYCVRFTRREVNCVPPILLFEMHRAVSKDEIKMRSKQHMDSMDDASVDACVFLHYLQYLTYGGLSDSEQALRAFNALKEYLHNNEDFLYHAATAATLWAHIMEMQSQHFMKCAFKQYSASVASTPHNNAANWHVRRLLKGKIP